MTKLHKPKYINYLATNTAVLIFLVSSPTPRMVLTRVRVPGILCALSFAGKDSLSYDLLYIDLPGIDRWARVLVVPS